MPQIDNQISDTRNVLVIAYYFPPMGLSGVQRTLKFVKYLPQYGWNPIVVTTGDDGYYAYDETLLEELNDLDIKIYRTRDAKSSPRKYTSYFVQKLGRAALQSVLLPDSKIRWKKKALEVCENVIKHHKIDVVFATAPPYTDFLVGKEFSDRHNLPLICDYRDLWVDNPFNFYLTRFHKNYHIGLERQLLRSCDKAIVTNRDAKETMIKRYHRSTSYKSIAIIPHGFDPDDFSNLQDIRPAKDKFVITHSGMFQDNRTPKYFIRALDRLLSQGNNREMIEARFVGLMRNEHIKQIKKSNFSRNYKLTGNLPHSEAITQLLESHVLWLMLKDTARSPGKLYEYIGARRPIFIMAPDGAMKQLTLESGAGFAAYPKDVDAIFRVLSELYQKWKSASLPTPNTDFVLSFDRQILTGDLARELSYAMR